MMTMKEKKLRVLHFGGTYLPVPGGTTTRIHNMLASPANEHLLVVPWPNASQCPDGLSGVRAEETRGHIHVRRVALPQVEGWTGYIPFWRTYLKAREFLKHVRGETVDIIHGHNPRPCAMASLHFKRLYNTPMVYEAHGIMRDDPVCPRIFGPVGPLNRISWMLLRQPTAYFERKVLDAADRVIVQTQNARRRMIELYGLAEKPIDVIRNGVDAERFDPKRWENQRQPLRHRHGWENRIVCLYAGYLNEVNGIDFLLEALPRLTGAARRQLKIVLLGRGPLQEQVKQAAKEHSDLLDYPGVVRHEEMPGYYAACDVFMIPRPPFLTAEMLLPMKLLEAMAMEKVVLVSNVAAMAEVVADGENGLVFEKGNTDDFLRKLEIIVQQGDRLGKLGKQARQDVLGQYTWEASRKKLQSIYEELVQ